MNVGSASEGKGKLTVSETNTKHDVVLLAAMYRTDSNSETIVLAHAATFGGGWGEQPKSDKGRLIVEVSGSHVIRHTHTHTHTHIAQSG